MNTNNIWKKINIIMNLTNSNKKIIRGHIEIKESPLGGLGVFATNDIPKNTLVTRYPINFLMNNETRAVTACPDLYSDLSSLQNCEDYVMKITIPDSNTTYSAIGDPQYKDNDDFLGHMLNDKAFKKGKNIYNTEDNNCESFGLEIYTIRDVKKGSELTHSYGKEYWFDKNINGLSRYELLS